MTYRSQIIRFLVCFGLESTRKTKGRNVVKLGRGKLMGVSCRFDHQIKLLR